jgi:uncharacterized protein
MKDRGLFKSTLATLAMALLFAMTLAVRAYESFAQSITLPTVPSVSIPLPELSFTKKLKLARAGDDIAQYAVALHYELGNEAREDAQQAAKWYREATLKGNLEAQYRLAKLIGKGAKGLSQDKSASFTLFQDGAEKGHAASQNEVGLKLQNGDGLAADPEKAAEWYKKSADQTYAPAMVNLGLLHVRGLGVAKDEKLAFQLFSDAAEKGDTWAMNNLGSMHEMGWGTAKDAAKARELYLKASALGNAMAQGNLARLDRLQQVKPEAATAN